MERAELSQADDDYLAEKQADRPTMTLNDRLDKRLKFERLAAASAVRALTGGCNP